MYRGLCKIINYLMCLSEFLENGQYMYDTTFHTVMHAIYLCLQVRMYASWNIQSYRN